MAGRVGAALMLGLARRFGATLMLTAAWLAPASAQPTNMVQPTNMAQPTSMAQPTHMAQLTHATQPSAVPQLAVVASFTVDRDEIRAPLAGLRGDAARGRTIVGNPGEATCLLCHAVPDSGQPVAGNVGPPLAGVGARLSEGQLRLRLVDSTRLNPQTSMPAYHRVEGLNRVGTAWQGKPVLTAQQVEDVVAYLRTLR